MNILFLCNKPPYPAREGGPIAMNMLIEGLVEQGHSVKVLTVSSYKYPFDPSEIPVDYLESTLIEAVEVDLHVRPLPAFLNLFTRKSYHVERFINKSFRKRLIRILSEQEFDIVQLETVFMAPYIPDIRKHSRAKIVLRAHNIEHLIWKRIHDNTRWVPKKAYLRHLWKTLKNFELSTLSRVDGIAAITKKDANFFRQYAGTVPVIDVSFGVDLSAFPWPHHADAEPNSLFHIGSMDWIPNQEGIRWFLEEVWPIVNRERPILKLYLAGRNMPSWLLNGFWPNVAVVGEVPDARQFMLSKEVMVVPLLAGSGIRIKIIEAMANGKAVVTTPVGAEGIEYTNGENLLVAEEAENFAQAILRCYSEPNLIHKLGLNARNLVEKEHNRHKLITELISFYQHLLGLL
ncbi:MAG: glycosyltransferase family 4 protein [Bacteroidota bacterium]|jgi:glycosyltransferase involved in cell wall biosynthesis|nr:glycosyltransferase [Bacteroidales bacterium]